MMPDIETILDDLIEREGGYVDHPADRGGPTKYGITMKTLAEYRGRPVTIFDIQDLTREEAENIYRNRFLTSHQLHRIRDPYLMVLVFDCAVHHGPHRAVRWLQQLVGIVDDGKFGDQTEIAVNSADSVRLYHRLLQRRLEFIGEIIAHDPKLKLAKEAGYELQAQFALGWLRRVGSFVGG